MLPDGNTLEKGCSISIVATPSVEDTQLPRRSVDRRRTAQVERGEKQPKGIVRLASGGYRANRQVNAKRSFVRRPTIAQCLDWLHQDPGANIAVSKDMTFGEWGDHWLEVMRSEPQRRGSAQRSETTLRSYEIRLQVYWSLRSQYLDSITADKIRGVENASGLADSPLHQARIILHAALQRAAKEKRITANLLDGVAAHVSTPKHQTRRVTDDDRRKLYDAAKGHRHGALLCTITAVGAREGEVRALHWENVRLTEQHGQIDIHYTAQQVPGKGTIIKAGGKTKASIRDNLTLDTATTRLLKELHVTQGQPRRGQSSRHRSPARSVVPLAYNATHE